MDIKKNIAENMVSDKELQNVAGGASTRDCDENSFFNTDSKGNNNDVYGGGSSGSGNGTIFG